jgi:predicted nucleic acid-binding protein
MTMQPLFRCSALASFIVQQRGSSWVSPADASAIVGDLRKGMSIIRQTEADLFAAMSIHQQHGFQFFDCFLTATVTRAGCTILFSEDFQHNYTIDTITIVNPFKLSFGELDALLP